MRRKHISKNRNQDPNTLISIPQAHSSISFGTFPEINLDCGILNLEFNRWKIQDVVLNRARRSKQVVHGARAMNAQLPLFFQRPTEDFDIFTSKPKAHANKVQSILDKEIAGGRDEFFVKPAIHPGTHKVMHQGADGIKRTKDDIVIVDYTEMPLNIPTVKIDNVRHQTICSIKQHRIQTLKDPQAKFRHESDREDVERIETSKILRGEL